MPGKVVIEAELRLAAGRSDWERLSMSLDRNRGYGNRGANGAVHLPFNHSVVTASGAVRIAKIHSSCQHREARRDQLNSVPDLAGLRREPVRTNGRGVVPLHH